MASNKTAIIEALFTKRWDEATQTLQNPVVTVDELKSVYDGQVYAFFKDIVRKIKSGNNIWPNSVLAKGYTGIQQTGAGAIFKFVQLPDGQTEAFSAKFRPSADTTIRYIESTSLPFEARRLGRSDEPWLIQVAVKLRLIETHLALVSSHNIVEVNHLQMSVKLQLSEIDALFLARHIDDQGQDTKMIVTCEAKGLYEDIIEQQIIGQVKAAFHQGIADAYIIPMAMKTVGESKIYVVEFDAIHKDNVAEVQSMSKVSEAIYQLIPPVPGIGTGRKRR